jgi:ABC-type multidrug transport system ATPase subunit
MNLPLEVDNISFTYPNKKGIHDITFHLNPGEILCLFGKNGSGKSTLFQVLSTLYKPQSGNFFVFGFDAVKKRQKIREFFFTVFDGNPHFDCATGKENIDFFISAYKSRQTEDMEKICCDFDLDLSMRTGEYSYGMKRKLYLIEAFLLNTQILFLDEPTLGLDSSSRELFYQLLKKRKTSSIIGTNRLEDVKFADRTLFLDKGTLQEVNEYEVLVSSLIKIRIQTATDEIIEYISSIDELPELIQNYSKHYRIKRIDVFENDRDIEWTKEAIEKVERAPLFVRKMIYGIVEEYAKKKKMNRITPEIVQEAQGRYEHR